MNSKKVLNLAPKSNGTPNNSKKAFSGGKTGAVSLNSNSKTSNQVSSVARKGSLDLSQTGGNKGKNRAKGVK